MNVACTDRDADGLEVVTYTHTGNAAMFTVLPTGFLQVEQVTEYTHSMAI